MEKPTQKQIDRACLYYRHDYGIMDDAAAKKLRLEAIQWWAACEKAKELYYYIGGEPWIKKDLIKSFRQDGNEIFIYFKNSTKKYDALIICKTPAMMESHLNKLEKIIEDNGRRS